MITACRRLSTSTPHSAARGRQMGFELDLRKVHLGQSGIASFATKLQALAFAKARGWLSRDVTRAYNRFCMFWVVYQGFGDTLRFLGKTDVVELPCSAIQPHQQGA